MKRIKLQTLLEREIKRKELKTVAEVLRYKHNFELKRMKGLEAYFRFSFKTI